MKFIGDAEKIKEIIKETPRLLDCISFIVIGLIFSLQDVCGIQFEYKKTDNILLLTALLKPTNNYKQDLQNFEKLKEDMSYDKSPNFKNNLLLNIDIQWLTEDEYKKIKTKKENG